MGVFVLLMFQLTIVYFPSSFAEEYKFCDAKPLGKYCLPDNSGWRECLIDALDEPAEELHHCPAGLKYGLLNISLSQLMNRCNYFPAAHSNKITERNEFRVTQKPYFIFGIDSSCLERTAH